MLAIGFNAVLSKIFWRVQTKDASGSHIMTDPWSPKEDSGSEDRFARQDNTSYSGWSSAVAIVIIIIIVGIVFYAIHLGH